jgi:hypothetical protein
MPKANTGRRPKVQPTVAAVVQPVARRLARMEALLREMRYEQDVQLKRSRALQMQFDALTEHVRASIASFRRISRRRNKLARPIEVARP